MYSNISNPLWICLDIACKKLLHRLQVTDVSDALSTFHSKCSKASWQIEKRPRSILNFCWTWIPNAVYIFCSWPNVVYNLESITPVSSWNAATSVCFQYCGSLMRLAYSMQGVHSYASLTCIPNCYPLIVQPNDWRGTALYLHSQMASL